MDRLLSEKLPSGSIKFFLRASLAKPGLEVVKILLLVVSENIKEFSPGGTELNRGS